MIGSFFIAERLSPSELNKIAELSEEELKNIIDRHLKNADGRIAESIDDHLDESSEIVERGMEKITNEKIMAINEYSDTVMENMNKTHNEIMFLYNMLNEKHAEMTEMTSELQRLAADVRNMQGQNASMQENAAFLEMPEHPVEKQNAAGAQNTVELPKADILPEEESTDVESKADASDISAAKIAAAKSTAESVPPVKENHNREILSMYEQGEDIVEIAKKLGLGLGEVKLVIGLYKGELKL
jgi:hypothetical protein